MCSKPSHSHWPIGETRYKEYKRYTHTVNKIHIVSSMGIWVLGMPYDWQNKTFSVYVWRFKVLERVWEYPGLWGWKAESSLAELNPLTPTDTIWVQLHYGYILWQTGLSRRLVCNFWHPLRADRQSVRMSKITNDGLTWSGTGCTHSCTHMATVGVVW